MRRPALLAVALAVLTVLAPATALATPDSVPTSDVASDSVQDGAPSDPDSDVLGWENGYWYNESIDVDPSDGLDDGELDAVVARAMARVEEVRQLEFEQDVPVEIYTREELQEETNQRSSNTSAKDRLHQNVKYEAMFMVNESTDAVSVQQANQGATVGGYYSPTEDRIVVVSENSESPQLNEVTLSQELFHALQDQQFDIESFDQSTREQHNAIDGILEGDGNYVDYLYEQRCGSPEDTQNGWGNCLTDTAGSSNGSGASQAPPSWGLYLTIYQPYSDGPAFVRAIHESGGWEAVNAIYENPPASTEQTIHPEKYEQDAPTQVNITDRSNEQWNVLDLEGSVDYAEFGEAGLAAMFMAPSFETQFTGGLLGPRDIYNLNGSNQVDSFDPLKYEQPWTSGWDGDKLLPYVTEDSASTNETGYVWKMHWDSPEEAQEFREGYQLLLQYEGATQAGQNTWVVEDGGFADAFHVTVDGNTTTIVNAPTVDDLSGVDSSITVQAVQNGTDTTSNGTDGDTSEGGENGTADAVTTTDSSDGSGPGFGVVVAVLALLTVAALARRE
ncbi:Hvo_1808 family surface protein [Halomarina salina]|uniref:Hvo_1808 family surface protein n=1 Tax=Halomarina salina TaxID=1872699 RepID=A0ABD5RKP1_9EURY|nr:Hvo_1808 family surface protein [Halomarina salina]